jgi:hypothetical protein
MVATDGAIRAQLSLRGLGHVTQVHLLDRLSPSERADLETVAAARRSGDGHGEMRTSPSREPTQCAICGPLESSNRELDLAEHPRFLR